MSRPTTKVKPVVRPTTIEDMRSFYGQVGPSFRAVTGLLDGEIVSIAGFAYKNGSCFVFCDLKDEARPYKHHIHRIALRLLKEETKRRRYIFAQIDEDEPSARKWLKRMGFEDKGEYLWLVSPH